jgi:hypothetical protein
MSIWDVLGALPGLLLAVLLLRGYVRRVLRTARDPGVWVRAVYELGRQCNLPVTSKVALRLVRRLRMQYVIGYGLLLPVNFLLLSGLQTIVNSGHRGHSLLAFVIIVMAVPSAVIVLSLVFAIPARGAARGSRVTHLVRPEPRQVFTEHEWTALALGPVAALLTGLIGFWRLGAGGWALLWPPAIAVGAIAWWLALKAVLRRPARASDSVELAWEDYFRYDAARGLSYAAAWLPPMVIFLIDFWLLAPDNGSFLPMYAAIATLVGVPITRVFNEGTSGANSGTRHRRADLTGMGLGGATGS